MSNPAKLISVKASDVRIGNKLLFVDFPGKGTMTVDADIISAMEKFPNNHTWYCIPLTPEILEKCGFDLYDPTPLMPAHKGVCYSIVVFQIGADGLRVPGTGKGLYFYKSDYRYWFLKDYPVHNRMRFLHQLQNLVFALTGEELEVKL